MRVGQMPFSRFLVLLFGLTLWAWMIDLPAVFGRCPGSSEAPSIGLGPDDPTGLVLGIFSGLITFFSPCGLPAFPAYMNFFLGSAPSRERRVSLAFLATSGFVFAILVAGLGFYVSRGLLVTTIQGGSRESELSFFYYIPNAVYDALGYLAGSLTIVMGSLMMLRVRLPFFKLPQMGAVEKRVRSVFLFSLGWGVATIACSPYALVPLLLYALAFGGLGPFIGYALGMALPVLSVSLLLSSEKGGFVRKLVAFAPRLSIISGVILIAAGVYIFVYTYNTPSQAGLFKVR